MGHFLQFHVACNINQTINDSANQTYLNKFITFRNIQIVQKQNLIINITGGQRFTFEH